MGKEMKDWPEKPKCPTCPIYLIYIGQGKHGDTETDDMYWCNNCKRVTWVKK